MRERKRCGFFNEGGYEEVTGMELRTLIRGEIKV